MTALDTPSVSLIIPVHNAGKYLKYTLASVSNQTLDNYECIVVDDGSKDDSITYYHEAANYNNRLRLIQHKINSGTAAARNSGIRAARGEFIAFLDADDLMMPDSLTTRLSSCRWANRASSRIAGTFGGSIQIEENDTVPPPGKMFSASPVGFVQNGPACPFNANQPMIRSDILRAAGGFNEKLIQSEDFDLWERILRGGYWFIPSKTFCVTYRRRQGSLIRSAPLKHLNLSLNLLNSSENYLSDDQIAWSPYRLVKPFSNYNAQSIKFKRVLEFCGMSLASAEPDDFSNLKNLVLREVPDLLHIIPPAKRIEDYILPGMRRQTGFLTPDLKSVAAAFSINLSEAAIAAEQDSLGRDVSKRGRSDIYPGSSENRIWFSGEQSDYDIIFIPHKAYHVWTVSLIMQPLQAMGVRVGIVDISAQWRDGGVREKAQECGLDLITCGEFMLGEFRPRMICVFNDWDPVTRPILVAAKSAGITTAAIVEGIQDYHDVDVHWTRHAYRTADVVLLPGAYDQKYFPLKKEGPRTVVVGVPRIQALYNEPLSDTPVPDDAPSVRVLINANFSYGVLEEHRDTWLESAVRAVRAADMVPVISRHPGDKGQLFPELVSDLDFYSCLETCHITVQRFASGILEAVARRKGVIYFNPHGEKVDKFQEDPKNCYPIVFDTDELIDALGTWRDLCAAVRIYGPAFLEDHAGELSTDQNVHMAKALQANLGRRPKPERLRQFRAGLQAIDQSTAALTRAVINKAPLFPDPNQAEALLNNLISDSVITTEPWKKIGATDLTVVVTSPVELDRELQSATPAADGDIAAAELLLLDPDGQYQPVPQDEAKIELTGTRKPVLVWTDPRIVVAHSLMKGQDGNAALDDWICEIQTWMKLARQAESDLIFIDRAAAAGPAKGSSLPVLIQPPAPEPLALAVAGLIVQRASEALRLLAQLDRDGSSISCDPQPALDALRSLPALHAGSTNSLAQKQLRQLQAALGTYWQDGERLRQELRRTQEALTQARQRGDALEAELDRVMRSRSVRLTRPLRGLRRIFGSGREKKT